jgi:hypothetical protein
MNIVTVEKNYNALVSGNFNYQVTYDNGQISFVPLDEANTDYQAIQEWIADGGTVIDNGGGE